MATRSVMLIIVLVSYLTVGVALAQSRKPGALPAVSPADEIQDSQIRSLQSRIEANFANLDCNTRKFDSLMMRSPKLLMFASCQNVEPYLEGHKLTLNIGNPYSFNFGSVKGQLKYGKSWLTDKEVEVSHAGDLIAGRWTTIVVTINPSAPEELRVLQLYLEASALSRPGSWGASQLFGFRWA